MLDHINRWEVEMMVNRILANYLICLESDDHQKVFNASVPDGYESTILAVADLILSSIKDMS